MRTYLMLFLNTLPFHDEGELTFMLWLVLPQTHVRASVTFSGHLPPRGLSVQSANYFPNYFPNLPFLHVTRNSKYEFMFPLPWAGCIARLPKLPCSLLGKA